MEKSSILAGKFMPVIAFSYKNDSQTHAKNPEIALDGEVLSIENAESRRRIEQTLSDRNSFVVSSSTEHNAKDLANYLSVDIDQIRAKKVDLHDLYRALQLGGAENKDPAEAFFERDLSSAQSRKNFAHTVGSRLNGYYVANDERLNEQQKVSAEQIKAEIMSSARVMYSQADKAEQILSPMQSSHAQKISHVFKRLSNITPKDSFNQHVSMINLNNEAGFGKNLFELDDKQAQDVLYTLQSDVDQKTMHIANKYLGMENGQINPEKKTEFTELITKHYPDMLMFGIQSDPQSTYKRLSSSELMSELLSSKMPDGTQLVNPAWFNDLARSGVSYDIREVHKDKSVAAHHLTTMQKPMGMTPKDEMRFDFVKDMIGARRAFLNYDKNAKDIEKLLVISEENDGKIPLSAKYAAAISKRFASSNEYNLNTLAMKSHTKSTLKAPGEGYIIDVDYSQAEVVMTAAMLGNKALMDAYENRSDIYLALGLQAKHVTVGKPLPWNELIEQSTAMQKNTPDSVKSDKNSEYHQIRSSGKMVAIPAIYGIGPQSLSEDQGISYQQAEILLKAFDHVFPEIKQSQDMLHSYMVNNVGNPNAQPLRFGGLNGDMVTVNANDHEFVNSYSVANPYHELMKDKDNRHQWMLNNIGVHQHDYEQPKDEVFSVTLSNGEKMVYVNPKVIQTNRGPSVECSHRDGKQKVLFGKSLLQNISQFATFSATREMTVNTIDTLEKQGIESKYLLNIHDSTAFLAKDEATAQQTLGVLQSGVMSKTQLAPHIAMAYSQDVGKHLEQVEGLKSYEPPTATIDAPKLDEVKNYDGSSIENSLNFEVDLLSVLNSVPQNPSPTRQSEYTSEPGMTKFS